MFWYIKSLLCKHDYKYVRGIYGDEIMFGTSNYNRKLYKCSKCGKYYYE